MAQLAQRFEIDTVRSGYIDLCKTVRDEGVKRAPRGLEIRELRGVTVVVNRPWVDAMPHNMGRGLNLAIGAAEALQLLGGVSYPQMMANISGTFNRFMDGEVLAGAYGPRIRPQIERVVQRLIDDPDSRQAVLVIWDPLRDLMIDSLDLPCTLGLQFFINEREELECHSIMRSNDLWWGFAYDIFQFSILQQAIADALLIDCGPLVHRANSFHVYARDMEKIEGMELKNAEPLRPKITAFDRKISTRMLAARAILDGRFYMVTMSDSGGWFTETMRPFVQERAAADQTVPFK